MNYEERIRQLRDHLASISPEQLEINLERAGLGRIKPLSSEDMRLLSFHESVFYSTLPGWGNGDLQDYQLFDSPLEVMVGIAA